jgi:hypothetical protein
MEPKNSRSTQICRGFTDDQWRALKKRLISNGVVQDDEAAWDCAIKVFERRIKERFLSCIEALEQADSRADVEVPICAPADCSTLPEDGNKKIVVPGFAIMALCCLLIETLQSFRQAPRPPAQAGGPCSYPQGSCIKPQPSGGKLIKEFLQLASFGGAFTDNDGEAAKEFVSGIRNGILHEAETRGWVIWRDQPEGRIVEREDKRYRLNRTEFYQALRHEFEAYLGELRDTQKTDLRKRFIEKMDHIVEKC